MQQIMKIIFIFSLISFAFALKFKSLSTKQNTELFNYSPDDEYTLPEDIDEDKPPVHFQGDVMKAQTLAIENKNHGKGRFKYSVQTQNGIEVTQVGKLKDDKKTFVVSGSYSYTGADGKRYRVRYTADEFGYHPITEIDVDIPNVVPLNDVNNGFEFLRKKINNRNNVQLIDNYDKPHDDEFNYKRPSDGYNYNPPKNRYLPPPSRPDRFYLPVYY